VNDRVRIVELRGHVADPRDKADTMPPIDLSV